MELADSSGKAGGAQTVAIVSCLAQALALLVLTCWEVLDAVAGKSQDASRGITAAVLFALAAVGQVALAEALRRRSAFARMPLIVWNVLLVPVAVSMAQSGQWLLATGIAFLVVVTLISGVAATPDRD